MDLEKDIVPKVSFDPKFQPFGHEQKKFITLVETVVDNDAVVSRSTDLQKKLFKFRFLEDKSYKEIASEMNCDVEKAEEIRERSVNNLLYIFEICKVDMSNVFDIKKDELKDQLTKGHEEILKKFEDFVKEGVLDQKDVEIAKKYSRIFNGLGDKDLDLNIVFGGGLSDNGERLENKDGNIAKITKRLRRVERVFHSKYLN